MYKNQLQELAQRSCFSLPSYTCLREGPDHAPRFKASVNFNGDIYESPTYCSTLRQAEHAAAEVAVTALSSTRPSNSLSSKVLDETGIYKNLLQETAHRAGLDLPVYTNVRSGPGHSPTFSCTVELAGMSFNGGPAKTKKQAEKNAAIAAWSSLKKMRTSLAGKEEKEQEVVARVLSSFRPKGDGRRGRETYPSGRAVGRCYRDTNSDKTSSPLQRHYQTRVKTLIPQSPRDPIKTTAASINLLITSTLQEQSNGGSDKKTATAKDLFHRCRGITEGLCLNPQKMAPAVQIRSVIPVCAAPPPHPTKLNPNPSSSSSPSPSPSPSPSSSSSSSSGKESATRCPCSVTKNSEKGPSGLSCEMEKLGQKQNRCVSVSSCSCLLSLNLTA